MDSILTLATFLVSPSPALLLLLVAIVAIALLSAFAYTQLRMSGVGVPQPTSGRHGSLSSYSRPSISTRKAPGASVPEPPARPGGRAPAAVLRASDGRAYPIGAEAAVIGSAEDSCHIVLPGDGVAPDHARIWIRDGRCLLHHVGGMSRKTYVSGEEVEWVVLDPGDEVRIGGHRLVFEYTDAPEAVVEERREPGIDEDLAKMVAAVRALWDEAAPASETAVGERSGTGKYKVHRRKDELAPLVGGRWVKRGRTVVLER